MANETACAPLRPKGPFPQFPSKEIIEDFRAHVIETGQPDTWVHHSASAPPLNEDFDEVIKFGVPHALRKRVQMASCPICSPSAPKYFEGVLAWFPGEGLLRAIGDQCATSHFGAERVARSKLKGQRDRAVDFLLEHLPSMAAIKLRSKPFAAVGNAMDDIRGAMFRASSVAAWQRVVKAGATGSLYVEEIRKIEAVDGFGRSYERDMPQVVAQYPVNGLGFMRQATPSSLVAAATLTAIELVATCDEDELIDFVAALEGRQQDLLDLERLLRSATAAAEQMEALIEEAKAFFSPLNLERLHAWTHDTRVDIGVVLSTSPYARQQFRLRAPPSSHWQTLTIPTELQTEP